MITTSQNFKTAIKNNNREMKGYVYVACEEEAKTTFNSVDTADSAEISTSYYRKNDEEQNKVKINYASLEENYFQLDGSFILPNRNNLKDAGYVSEDLMSTMSISDTSINPVWEGTFSSAVQLKGITIYFGNSSIPINVNVVINDSVIFPFTNNSSSSLFVDFNGTLDVTSIGIVLKQVERTDRRLRINYIDLARTMIYQGNSLLSFEVIEEISRFNENIPVNTFTLNLSNIDGKYDPINPTGMAKALKKGETKAIPQVGVLTESSGIEYVKCGEFLFRDWSADTGGTAKLNFSSYMADISEWEFLDGYSYLFQSVTLSEANFKNFLTYNYVNRYGIDIEFNGEWRTTNMLNTKYTKFIDFIKDIAIKTLSNVKISRSSDLYIGSLDTSVVDTLYRSYMKSEPQYEVQDKVNKVIIKGTGFRTDNTTQNAKTLMTYQTRIVESPQTVRIDLSSPALDLTGVSASSGSVTNLSRTSYYTKMLRLTGTIGSDVTITVNGKQDNGNTSESKQEFVNIIPGEPETTFEVNSPLLIGAGFSYIGNYILNNSSSYKIRVSYNGDPSIEAGDMISVETKYGIKTMFITKNTMTFDGGFSCSIEGVGN